MGDPKRITNKFQKPAHPWNKARIEQEKPLMQKFGLQSKKELWKVTSKLKTYKQNAKRLIALKGTQAEKERQQMFDKLHSFGLAQSNTVDDILGMNPEQLLDRRLQTVVYKKGLARTIKQARQMITHKHIVINGRKITAPGHLVKVSEEHTIAFYPGSNFFNEDHPERPPRAESKEEAPKMPADAKKKAPAKKKSESEKVEGEKKDE